MKCFKPLQSRCRSVTNSPLLLLKVNINKLSGGKNLKLQVYPISYIKDFLNNKAADLCSGWGSISCQGWLVYYSQHFYVSLLYVLMVFSILGWITAVPLGRGQCGSKERRTMILCRLMKFPKPFSLIKTMLKTIVKMLNGFDIQIWTIWFLL